MGNDIDVSNMQDTTPSQAPVEPLTGKEKAGVSLTWGIIWVLVGFLLLILGIFFWGETKFNTAFEKLAELDSEKVKNISTLVQDLTTSQEAFRAFWFDTLQLILLNVLFPTGVDHYLTEKS